MERKIMELKCFICQNLHTDSNKRFFCKKLNCSLENGETMLYYGGAIGYYGANGKIVYQSKCGIKDSDLKLK
jgi:hypothetical protein